MKKRSEHVIHISQADEATNNLVTHAYQVMTEGAGKSLCQAEFMKNLASEYLTLKTLGKYWVRAD
jgi:hypothetical protein